MRALRSPTVALIVVALNLRLAVAALPPVLSQIRHATGLSSAGGGVLTALPVFCFGLAALAAPRLIRRFGMSRLLAFTALVVLAGCLLRMVPSLLGLFIGTVVLGVGIAIGNVLVPGLIRRDFHPQRVLMTALYSVALAAAPAAAAGLTIPIEHALGVSWRVAITVWAVFTVLALVLWTPHARREHTRRGAVSEGERGGAPEAGNPRRQTDSHDEGANRGEGAPLPGLWRDGVAWSVTSFFGIQAFGFYAILSWLPTILEDHGTSAGTAGAMFSLCAVVGMLSTLVAPALERRARRRGTLVTVSVALCAMGFAGLLVAPGTVVWVWCILIGLGQGAPLSLALGYIVARSPTSNHAAQLSTMVQSAGYLIGAAGPFALGALHGVAGTWTLALLVLLLTRIPMLGAGLVAAQDRFILARRTAS